MVKVYKFQEGVEYDTELTWSAGTGTFGDVIQQVSEISLVDPNACEDDDSAVAAFGGCAGAVAALGCDFVFGGVPISENCPETCGECNDCDGLVDDCGVCDGDNSTCSGCTDSSATNYDPEALVDDASCEFEPVVVEDVEELESYDSTVDIDVPEVEFEDVQVDIDIPAGGLDVPDGTEVTLEFSEASEEELQDIIDSSSSADADVEVYQGVSFEAVDQDGNQIELAEGETLDVQLTFEPGRNEYDLGYITEFGELVALGADCIDNGDGSWTCAGDGPGFGSYIVYSYDPDQSVEGCSDESACNYDSEATLNDGSCEYPEDNFDCDGNCVVEFDCLGECGGDAVVDE